MGYTGNSFRYHMEQDEAFANSVNAAWAEWKVEQLEDEDCGARWKLTHADPDTFTTSS